MTPLVTILLPTLNERAFVTDCLDSLCDQDYPEVDEILVVDGGSTDGTRAIVQRHGGPSPTGRQSEGDGSRSHERRARGAAYDVIVRADAHTLYARDYVSSSVKMLVRTDGSGGRRADDVLSASRPSAERSPQLPPHPLELDQAGSTTATGLEEVDTVYLGTFRKATVVDVGGYDDEDLQWAAEDQELNFRIRRRAKLFSIHPFGPSTSRVKPLEPSPANTTTTACARPRHSPSTRRSPIGARLRRLFSSVERRLGDLFRRSPPTAARIAAGTRLPDRCIDRRRTPQPATWCRSPSRLRCPDHLPLVLRGRPLAGTGPDHHPAPIPCSTKESIQAQRSVDTNAAPISQKEDTDDTQRLDHSPHGRHRIIRQCLCWTDPPEFPDCTIRIFSRTNASSPRCRSVSTAIGSATSSVMSVDLKRLLRASQGADVIIHAAAMKQVIASEYNPFEAVQTNVTGAQNIVDAAIDAGVRTVVALSTDKAVNPVNLDGATKLCAEKLIVHGNSYASGRETRSPVSGTATWSVHGVPSCRCSRSRPPRDGSPSPIRE